MATLPNYLQEQTEEAIRQRMLDRLPSDLDKSEGSFIWDALSPAAIELTQAAIWAQETLRRGFASTTFGPYLDLRCEEHGLTRRPAVKAKGQVKLTGAAGTVVPAGTRVATPADRVTGTSSVEFATTEAVAIGGDGTAVADVEALQAGAAGNVSSGAISLVVTPVPNVTAVTNVAPTAGGLNVEDDASLLARYFQKVRSPSAGGNKADYVNWALEVPGVGGVSVVPVRDGPGTVSVAVINNGKQPADADLIDAVQSYIAPPHRIKLAAESMTLSGSGVSVDKSLPDDEGDSVKLAYSSAGAGRISQPLHAMLPQPGVWQVRLACKAGGMTGTSPLLQIGVWNAAAESWLKTRPSGTTDAVRTLRAADMTPDFAVTIQEFYWNGQDPIELRVDRLQTDTTTVVWVDGCELRSTFSKATGEGKAPIGAKVVVESASPVLINVSATLTFVEGYNQESVEAAVRQNIETYLRSLAFAEDNDVRYARIAQAVLDTTGVQDYANLQVNGGPGNVTVGVQEVAVLGAVTLA
ncbi:baseplate J/gp47 family protein [Paenibacillus flagellatus]|uniref:Baseplate protein J-like domain-containing protein n=1 Tax=Paenibacillus flagellatus TaxID=2211139 RepID=A0A2V5K1Q4_9BACL|nr:baseplate J/gp47 family protein [Paenibacillus flagellatus]PYI52552.1 hypothetical protein DLM86_20475 [Paenibacillus flagellatus]